MLHDVGMRQINWMEYHPKSRLHLRVVRSVELIAYDKKGRIYAGDDVAINPILDLPLIIWAEVRFIGYSYSNAIIIGCAIDFDKYAFGWRNKRLSSLPRHKHYFKDNVWLSEADRDFIFDALTQGMYDD